MIRRIIFNIIFVMTFNSFNLLFSQEQEINRSDWSITTEIKDSDYYISTPLGCVLLLLTN